MLPPVSKRIARPSSDCQLRQDRCRQDADLVQELMARRDSPSPVVAELVEPTCDAAVGAGRRENALLPEVGRDLLDDVLNATRYQTNVRGVTFLR